jgi:hypothetical protein
MAAFLTMTEIEQELVLEHLISTRAQVAELGRLTNRLAAMQTQWTDTIAPLVTALDAASQIPDIRGMPVGPVERYTGLDGVAPITRENLITMRGTSIANFLATYNTTSARQLYTLFGGPMNVVG